MDSARGKMRVYLDNCCFNRPYDDQTQIQVAMEAQSKLHIQDLIREGRIDLVGSFTLDFECSRNPSEMRREAIFKFIRENMKAYVGPERDPVLSQKAAEIMSKGIKEKDAFHLASAIYAGCKYFISTDSRLLKHKTDEIKMINPLEFIMETEGE